MGQTIGRAPLPAGCKRFLNLPRSCIYDLWESFNDIAEGFGLTIEEFQEIIKSALMEYVGVTEKILNIDTEIVFRLYDDDENNLVDSLEFLSSFALLSGMTPEEKIRYIFAMYDFDESGMLTLDEMVLAFRSTLAGLAKLSKVDPPTEAEVELIVVQGFDAVRKASNSTDVDLDYAGLDREIFLQFCLNTPEIMSWIEFFDDLEEYEMDLSSRKAVILPEPSHLTRTINDESVMNPTLGGFERLRWEKKGLARDLLPRMNYQNVIQYIQPTRAPDQVKEVPPHNVQLEWVYGYNAHSSKMNLFYSAKGALIYPAGAICVIHDSGAKTQNFFNVHTDVVICLKLYHTPEGNTIVASGECGQRPTIHVWEAETRTVLSSLKGFHRNGVMQLDFSPDRTKLATIGMDTYHSIAVYLWRTGERIFASRSTFEKVLDIRFISDELFASCGKDHVYFWKETKQVGYRRYRGLFGVATKPETLCTVAAVGSTIITGSESGVLHVWEGRNVISSIKGHTGAINVAYVVDQGEEKGLVTACTLGKIQVWNSKLEIGATFNANALGPIEPSLSSVCWNLLTSKILIGFKTCEIFEMDATDGRNVWNSAVTSAHFHPKVSGLAVHPTNPKLFCTVGNDKTVRVFDAELHKQLRVSRLDTVGNCAAISPDGQMILIGLGTGIEGMEERKEGAYVVLNEADLTLIQEARDSKLLITDCKFSPNGDIMALSSLDGSIYVYNSRDYAAKSRCRGHVGKVIHFDFSHDGQFMQSNCTAGELLFWDAEKGELQLPKVVKEVQWETGNCIYSYATQGIWGPFDDGVKINQVCRSHAKDMVVAVDNFGRVRIYNNPCYKEDPNFILCTGHAAEAQNCRFSCDDSYLFTTGGTDGCILQWKVSLPDTQDYEEMKRDESIKEVIPYELRFEGKIIDRTANHENVVNDRPHAICLMEEGVVDVSTLQPWQRTICAPSRVPIEDLSEPPDSLELEFVYGFAADKSRQSCMYAPNGDIAFFGAGVAVIMNQAKRTQRFYQDHSSTITAMSVHPSEPYIATGEHGETPCIRVWNSSTLETVSVMQGFHRRAIAHLKFSPNGNLLATVGLDKYHSIAVYDWKNMQMISHSNSFLNKSLFIDFNPAGTGLIHCGNEIIRFWEMKGRNMTFQDALLGTRAKLQGYLCAGWIANAAIVGTTDGNLYRFSGRQLDAMVQAHSGAINAISYANEGLISASADGYIKMWTRLMECRLVIDLKSLRAQCPIAKTVCWDSNYGRIVIGTASAEIYEVSSGDGENIHPGPLLEGHNGEELWGLAVNPLKDEYCTVGDDAMLKVWNIFTHASVAVVPLELPSRCCAFSPNGKSIAIGMGCPTKLSARQYDGKWIIMDADDYQVTHEARDSTKWITDIKYSPNGELIAMGSTDNKIYVYSVSNGYALNATITQHQSFITAIDFSEDSTWLQSNCGGFELCYFEADTGMYIPAASRLRDQAWATQNCAMAWPVQGIWPPQKDATECTACDCNLFRGSDGIIVASGDNYGRVQLWRYPCTSAFAVSKKYRMGSNPITRMRFVSGDSMLITISGIDKVIMQWAHKRDRTPDIAWNVNERKGAIEEDEEDVLKLMGLAGAEVGLPDMKELDNLVASRPWVASVVAPTNPREGSESAPEIRLEKAHVFGCQTEGTRASVHFNRRGDIIYPASRYACVYNKKMNEQLYYEGHTHELSCIGVSRDGFLVASVEKKPQPRIHVWDANTCELIIILPLLHRRGVSYIQFSADRKKMVSVGQDQDHSIALWESPTGEWTDGALLACAKGDVNPALFCSFYDNGKGGYVLGSGGRYHQKFWYVNGKCLNANYAAYDNKQKIGTLLCGTSVGHHFVSGSTSGHLFVWNGRKLDRMVRAHELGVSAIWSCDKGVVTGSKDGMVKLWTLDLEHIRSFMLADADVPPILASVRSLDATLSLDKTVINKILVATAGGEIYEISSRSGNTSLVHEAHFTGELWGICTHPTDPDLFATVGDDKTIRVWSVTHRRLLRKAVLDCTARTVDWSHDGKNLVLGMGGSADGKRQRKDGSFLVLDAVNLRPLFEGRDSRHWLRDIKFSPDNRAFAVASMDHKIYVYSRETFRLKGVCDRHNSFIKDFNFSEDGVYIQSDSGDYEHLYFEAEDGEYFSAGSQLKDIRWYNWTCTFGWPVQGAWPYYDDVNKGLAFEPTCVNRSPDETLLAVGDLGGCVKLYHYPCLSKTSNYVKQDAHVKEVSKVRFTCDGKHLLSIGKMDKSIIAWKVLPENVKRGRRQGGLEEETKASSTSTGKKEGSNKSSSSSGKK